MALKKLSEIVDGYPVDYPQTLAQLRDADPDSIVAEVAWDLRRQISDAVNRSDSHYIHTFEDVLKMLANSYVLHPWSGKWRAYALSAQRQPVLEPATTGHSRYKVHTSGIIPKAEELVGLPNNTGPFMPGWLLLYGGTPEILTKPGVAKGLETLSRRRKLLDVVFVDDDRTVTYSVRNGMGIRPDGEDVEFPEGTQLHANSLKEALNG